MSTIARRAQYTDCGSVSVRGLCQWPELAHRQSHPPRAAQQTVRIKPKCRAPGAQRGCSSLDEVPHPNGFAAELDS